jgi:hypothetical protein
MDKSMDLLRASFKEITGLISADELAYLENRCCPGNGLPDIILTTMAFFPGTRNDYEHHALLRLYEKRSDY